MPTRSLTVDGRAWRVFPAGHVTQYDHDEFAVPRADGIGVVQGAPDPVEVADTAIPTGTASDIADRGYGRTGVDFLECQNFPDGCQSMVTGDSYGVSVSPLV